MLFNNNISLFNFVTVFCKEFALEKPLDNIALDLTINSRLMVNYQGELEFIEGGMLPANFPELQLEEEKDSLYYYNKLKEAKDKKEESQWPNETAHGHFHTHTHTLHNPPPPP